MSRWDGILHMCFKKIWDSMLGTIFETISDFNHREEVLWQQRCNKPWKATTKISRVIIVSVCLISQHFWRKVNIKEFFQLWSIFIFTWHLQWLESSTMNMNFHFTFLIFARALVISQFFEHFYCAYLQKWKTMKCN